MRVLVVNAGSSSLKLSLIGPGEEPLGRREIAARGEGIDREALEHALAELSGAQAVGHRIVHGGLRFREAVRIDPAIERELAELTDLAPLHQRRSLAALDEVSSRIDLPAVACFDTAFHATLPAAAATYALPAQWRERWPLRRFGFHGLSHAWIARRAPQLIGADPEGLRILSAHLGSGASLCAIESGRSLDTTMGFTPLEGVVMATRSGSIDPGLLLWLADGRLPVEELAEGLEHGAGLLGLAGTADMRQVLDQAERGEERAKLALEVYTHRLRAEIAAMAASLRGIDVLAFTGGIGERAPAVRELAVAGLGFLGLALDSARNRAATGDAEISAEGATAKVVVIEAREDLEIARQTRAVLEAP